MDVAPRGGSESGMAGRIGDQAQAGLPDGGLVARVDQQAVTQFPEDLGRAAVPGGDHRYAGGGRFDQGQPEGLVPGGVDEDATLGGTPVQRRNIGGPVPGRQRDVALQGRAGAELPEFGDDLPFLGRAMVAIVLAREDDEVGPRHQRRPGRIGADERG